MQLVHDICLAAAYVLGTIVCIGCAMLVTYMGYIIWQNERQEIVERRARGPVRMIDITPRR